jgi:hypothetical protein
MGLAGRRRDLGALTAPLAAASFIAGVGASVKLAGSPPPRPGSQPEEVRKYYEHAPQAGRVNAVGQLLSAASMARFTASVARLAGRSGSGPLRAVALAGGGLAAASLAVSAAGTATLTGSAKDDDGTAVRLNDGAFAAGGPVHGAAFAVLTGALGLAGLRSGELPRPLAIAALVSAGVGLLSPLWFASEKAALVIPIGRFSGLLVNGIAGGLLASPPLRD